MKRAAFTLVELLVSMAIVAVLTTLLIVGTRHSLDSAKRTACISNLRQISAGISAYAGDHDGKIPYGPVAGGYTNAGSFYPSTGAPTSLISLQSGEPVALGLLLKAYLARDPRVLFCPGAGGKLDAATELAKVGHEQAQCSYYYRHGGNTQLFDSPLGPPPEPPLRLAGLGENSRGKPIRALVMDTIFVCPKELKDFNVQPVNNHRGEVANVLYTDGVVLTLQNSDNRYTVDVKDFSQVRKAFQVIMRVLERADDQR